MNPAAITVLLGVLTPAGYACAGTAPALYATQVAVPAAQTLRTIVASDDTRLFVPPASRKRQPSQQQAEPGDFRPVAIIHR